MEALTPKQEKFCQEYMVDLNGKQAAIRAGYSENSASVISAQNLTKLNVNERIAELKAELSKSTKITQEWVLNRFRDISDRCMTAVPVMIRDDDGIMIESGDYKFDSSGANKATEMLGKHLGFFEQDNKQKVIQAPVINILPPTSNE